MKKTTLLAAGATLMMSVFSVSAQTLYYMESSTGLDKWPLEQGPFKIVMADLNGDGYVDIAHIGDHGAPKINTSEPGGIMIYFGNKNGTWTSTAQSGSFGYGGICAGDVNGDGKIDLGYAMHHNYSGVDFGDQIMEVALNTNGNGQMWSPWDNGLGSNGEGYGMGACDFADLDHDGKLDYGALSFGCGPGACNGVQIYKNNGDGSWTNTDGLKAGNVGNDFMFADLDNDGNHDVLAGWEVAFTNLGSGDGTFNKGSADTYLKLGVWEWWNGISTGDVDGNGTQDMAYASDSVGIKVYGWDYNKAGANKWKDLTGNLPTGPAVASYYAGTKLADMNSDGFMDICLYNKSATIDIWLGDGTGNWTQDYSIPVGGSTMHDWAIEDVDHDGFPDIAIVYNDGINRIQFFKHVSQDPVSTLSIHSTYPGSNVCMKGNTVTNIKWVSGVPNGATATVKLEFSSTGINGPWTTIKNGANNSGTYQWVTPTGVSSGDCYIKFTINDGSGSSTITSQKFGIGADCFNTVGVKENASANGLFTVFPNPSNGLFTVNVRNLKSSSTLQVFDMMGKAVFQSTINVQDDVALDLQNEVKGIYLVRLTGTDGTSQVKKITIQ